MAKSSKPEDSRSPDNRAKENKAKEASSKKKVTKGKSSRNLENTDVFDKRLKDIEHCIQMCKNICELKDKLNAYMISIKSDTETHGTR